MILYLTATCGYAQVDIFGYFEPQYNGLYCNGVYHQLQTDKLRVDLKSKKINNVEFDADVIYLLYFGKTDWDLLNFLPERISDAIPADLRPYYQFVYRDSLYLDNVYMRISNYRLALTIGKQQISLGTGYFVNPTDVFNTKNALDPTYEQPGHNAIRGDLALANRLNLMALYTPIAFDWKTSGKLLRLKVGIGHFDISVLGYVFQQTSTDYFTFEQTQQYRRLAGGDLSGEILGLGVWAEGCYNFMDDDNNFYEFIAGTDYTFGSGLYAMTEYHHNSLGKSNYTDYNLNDWLRFYAGESKSIGRDEVYEFIQYPVSDFIKVGTSTIFNISDQSVAFVPMVCYNIFENLDLTLMFNIYLGREGTAFGDSYGDGGFLRCQVYF